MLEMVEEARCVLVDKSLLWDVADPSIAYLDEYAPRAVVLQNADGFLPWSRYFVAMSLGVASRK
jgi:hypothetical protein